MVTAKIRKADNASIKRANGKLVGMLLSKSENGGIAQGQAYDLVVANKLVMEAPRKGGMRWQPKKNKTEIT
jgi:hypothetical protein